METALMNHPALASKNPLDTLMKHVFVAESTLEEECADLEAALQQGDGMRDYASLVPSVDAAERNARRAYGLFVTATHYFKEWEITADVFEAGLRDTASNALQEEKDSGKRTKAITISDVDTQMMKAYSHELSMLKSRRTRWELTVKSMENLSKLWDSRCRTLQAMLSKSR